MKWQILFNAARQRGQVVEKAFYCLASTGETTLVCHGHLDMNPAELQIEEKPAEFSIGRVDIRLNAGYVQMDQSIDLESPGELLNFIKALMFGRQNRIYNAPREQRDALDAAAQLAGIHAGYVTLAIAAPCTGYDW